jgi:crotonobetainyl-CoA:carnitine CoA-transferase CaiB-like acyl-CoA transferase
VADVIGMGIPITFSESDAGDLRAAPCVGQDNALVYGEWLGYGSHGVARMQAAGII